jgi:hypothetical protein
MVMCAGFGSPFDASCAWVGQSVDDFGFGVGLAAGFSVDSAADVAGAASFDPTVDATGVSDEPSPPVGTAASSASFAFERLLDRRSTFAQPEPLKWTVGAMKALRIGAPHTGQVSGPEA